MIEAAKEAKAIKERLEPVEGVDRTSQLEAAYAQNSVMLALLDYVGTFYEKQMYQYAL